MKGPVDKGEKEVVADEARKDLSRTERQKRERMRERRRFVREE
jgi:hypothetical protein